MEILFDVIEAVKFEVNIRLKEIEIATWTNMVDRVIECGVGVAKCSKITGERRALILKVRKPRYFRAVDREGQCVAVDLGKFPTDSLEIVFEVSSFGHHRISVNARRRSEAANQSADYQGSAK